MCNDVDRWRRFPNEIYDMMNQYAQSQEKSSVPGNYYHEKKILILIS
jgi:hypothetical protein